MRISKKADTYELTNTHLLTKKATGAASGKGGAGKLSAIVLSVRTTRVKGHNAGTTDVDTIGLLTLKTHGSYETVAGIE